MAPEWEARRVCRSQAGGRTRYATQEEKGQAFQPALHTPLLSRVCHDSCPALWLGGPGPRL